MKRILKKIFSKKFRENNKFYFRYNELKKIILFWRKYPQGVIFADDHLFEYFSNLNKTKIIKISENISFKKKSTCLDVDFLPEFNSVNNIFTNYLIDTQDSDEFFFANSYFFFKNLFFLYEKNPSKIRYNSINKFKFLLFENNRSPQWYLENFSYKYLNIKKIKKIDRPVISLSSNGNNNYFHWMHFPALINYSIVDEYYPEIMNDSMFYYEFPNKMNIPNFTSDSLKKLGVNTNRICNFPVSGNRMICNFQNYHNISFSPKHLRFLKKRFNYNSNIDFYDENIFVSRSDANFRKLLNEDEIFNYLKKFNFKKVTLNEMSLNEQILLYNNAKIIIAPHGASQNNLSFCNNNQTIVELFSKNHLNNFFYQISYFNNLNYAYLIGEPISNSAHSDYFIDINKLKFLLSKLV